MKSKLSTEFDDVVNSIFIGGIILAVLLAVMFGIFQARADIHEESLERNKRSFAIELDRRYIYGQGDKFVKEYSDFTHVGTCLHSLKVFLREADVDIEHFRPYCSEIVASRKMINFYNWFLMRN